MRSSIKKDHVADRSTTRTCPFARFPLTADKSQRDHEPGVPFGLGSSSVESSDGCALDVSLCVSKVSLPGRTVSASREVGPRIKLLVFLLVLLKFESETNVTNHAVMLIIRSRPGHHLFLLKNTIALRALPPPCRHTRRAGAARRARWDISTARKRRRAAL